MRGGAFRARAVGLSNKGATLESTEEAIGGSKLSSFASITASLSAALILSACATPGISPPPQIVNVPVPVSCLPSTMPVRPPVHTDPQLSALDDFKFTLAIFSDRRALLDYSSEFEAVLQACR